MWSRMIEPAYRALSGLALALARSANRITGCSKERSGELQARVILEAAVGAGGRHIYRSSLHRKAQRIRHLTLVRPGYQPPTPHRRGVFVRRLTVALVAAILLAMAGVVLHPAQEYRTPYAEPQVDAREPQVDLLPKPPQQRAQDRDDRASGHGATGAMPSSAPMPPDPPSRAAPGRSLPPPEPEPPPDDDREPSPAPPVPPAEPEGAPPTPREPVTRVVCTATKEVIWDEGLCRIRLVRMITL